MCIFVKYIMYTLYSSFHHEILCVDVGQIGLGGLRRMLPLGKPAPVTGNITSNSFVTGRICIRMQKSNNVRLFRAHACRLRGSTYFLPKWQNLIKQRKRRWFILFLVFTGGLGAYNYPIYLIIIKLTDNSSFII